MKKITKLSILWIALLSSAFMISNSTTQAAKNVTLTLTEWSNTCTILDYALWTKTVSVSQQSISSSAQNISCSFYKNAANEVTLTISDLSDWSHTIAKSNFKWTTAKVSKTWTISDLTGKTSFSLASATWVYTKEINKIWTRTWTLKLDLTIPAWQPGWSYTGTIDLTLQS